MESRCLVHLWLRYTIKNGLNKQQEIKESKQVYGEINKGIGYEGGSNFD